jgi:hypothetical protein
MELIDAPRDTAPAMRQDAPIAGRPGVDGRPVPNRPDRHTAATMSPAGGGLSMGVCRWWSLPVRRGRGVATLVLVLAGASLVAGPSSTLGADPTPGPASSPDPSTTIDHRIHLTVEPLLGGLARADRWVTIRVHAENDGPAVDGELRISSLEKQAGRYATAVELPTGARQEHLLSMRLPLFGRMRVELVSRGAIRARVDTQVRPIDDRALGVGIIAEHPERLGAAVRGALDARGSQAIELASLGPTDLPSAPQAWHAMDLLVWQDVPAATLDADQVAALATWVADGGSLLLLGGSMGPPGLDGLDEALLPYLPTEVVEVPSAVLDDLVGGIPVETGTVTALAGPHGGGVTLAQVGDEAIAATRVVGRGRVTLIGIDPASQDARVADALWDLALPSRLASGSIGGAGSDRSLATALAALPAVAVPRQDHLLALLVLYLLLLGPVSYLVLKRLDRLAWAWVTTPVLIGLFAVAAFLLGVVLKGTTIVVRELAVVSAGTGVTRGSAEVQLSVFSPNRALFDVRVPPRVLLSDPVPRRRGEPADALDIVASPGLVRGLRVESGATTALRAEASVAVPELVTDLSLVEGTLSGSIVNASDTVVEDVTVLAGGGVQELGDLAPGERASVKLATAGTALRRRALQERLLPDPRADDPMDAEEVVSRAGRRALLRHASGRSGFGQSQGAAPGTLRPIVLAWRSDAPLAVDLGTPIRVAGETLYVLRAPVSVHGPITVTEDALPPRLVEATATTAIIDAAGSFMDRGTATVVLQPRGFLDAFSVTDLVLRLAPRGGFLGTDVSDLEPLPDAQQPDQLDPVGSAPPSTEPADEAAVLPRVQLFDRAAARWMEFPPFEAGTTYRIPEPERYVDQRGALLVRFVLRTADQEVRFQLQPRMEGTIA